MDEKNSLKQVDNHHNFWIHRVDLNIVSFINSEKIIAATKKRSTAIANVHSGDRIFLLTKRNNILEFFGYTQVDEVYLDKEPLFDYYFSKKKLKLKGIKYFSKPISVREIALDLDFIKNKKLSAQYLKSDYRQISKDDFINIRKKANLIKAFPSYLEEISMSFKEFMISTINAVYMMIKSYQNGKQIEIKKFLNILKKFLDEYGINKSLVEIQEFYSRHAIELGFKHLPSRDPDKFVQLYTFSGEKRNFAYISFE